MAAKILDFPKTKCGVCNKLMLGTNLHLTYCSYRCGAVAQPNKCLSPFGGGKTA